MDIDRFTAVLRTPHGLAQWLMLRDVRPYLRVQFLLVAIESGLLRALRAPRTRDELVRDLGAARPDLLDSVLRLGVALKELAVRGGRYRLVGRRSRALAEETGDHLAAMVEEMTTYHASVYRELARRIRGAEPGRYLDDHAAVLARSSRVLEPFVGSYVRKLVRDRGAVRMLEIGCGSGVYLRYAAEANSSVRGVAIEVQPEVARQAAANLGAWGIGERFRVIAGDVRQPPPDIEGPFDLVTLHNNIYYFAADERPALFGRLQSWLAPKGRLVVSSLMQGDTLAALDLDVALACTVGCTPLPDLDELLAQLRATPFTSVEPARLMPLEPLYGIVATV